MLIVVYIVEANSKPYQKSEMELFPKVASGYRGKFRICQASKKESNDIWIRMMQPQIQRYVNHYNLFLFVFVFVFFLQHITC